MRLKLSVLSIIVILVAALVPLANAAPPTQGNPTPTKPGLGQALFGTPRSQSTPTATPPEMMSTSSSLPTLTAEDLHALNLQTADLPSGYQAEQVLNDYSLYAGAVSLKDGYPDLSDQLVSMSKTYGWDWTYGLSYDGCVAPYASIGSEIAQLKGPQAARELINDSRVPEVYQQIGALSSAVVSITPTTSVHGWLMIFDNLSGSCFATETDYNLNFEYWGLLITVQATVEAGTDPAQVNVLLDQLAQVIISRVNASVPTPFEPTPAFVVAAPTPSTLPIVQNLPDPQAIEAIMPTIEEVGLPQPTFALDTDLSTIYTAEDIPNWYVDWPQMHDALQLLGEQTGFLGQVTHVWDVGPTCTDTVGWSLEVDIAYFETEQGALAYLNDTTVSDLWLASGYYKSFEPTDDGGLLATATFPYESCGDAPFFAKTLVHGRYMVSAAVIGNPDADSQELINALDVMADYLIQKLDQAGLQ